MRIWSIHPMYLDWKGLGALWREALLAQKVLLGNTKGWRNHPQLDRFRNHAAPMKAIGYYLLMVHKESLERCYSYDYTKILEPANQVKNIPITKGQINYEFTILNERLSKRNVEKFKENLKVGKIEAHPLFKIVEGPPESWEKSYWKKNT